jgi:hypothetical protein
MRISESGAANTTGVRQKARWVCRGGARHLIPTIKNEPKLSFRVTTDRVVEYDRHLVGERWTFPEGFPVQDNPGLMVFLQRHST